MVLNLSAVDSGLGIRTEFFNAEISKLESSMSVVIDEFSKRANQAGQFLNWVNLPENQILRLDDIYSMAEKLKAQTGAEILTVLGIGGSKHTVENMLSLNGLNLCGDKVLFYSDVDSVSFARFLSRLGNDVTKSNYMVASKSGSTFETKDGFLRIKKMLEDAYISKGNTQEEAKKLASKHFIAVTDKNSEKSELRRTSNSEGWLGDLFIHDDVGGRFSALDDHSLFTLAFAGMKKEDMRAMLASAQKMSEVAMTKDSSKNMPYAQASFWALAKSENIQTSVHQYLGSMFEYTANWHAQMQNESIKDTLKQIAKVPDAMHHSSEAHFNPANKFAFALTVPVDTGVARENAEGYIGALSKSYSNAGPYFCEHVETAKLGLTPEVAGALVQARAFATVYQEIIEKTLNNVSMPEVLESVLQPHVEVYKKNLKPQADGKDVVVAGRIS